MELIKSLINDIPAHAICISPFSLPWNICPEEDWNICHISLSSLCQWRHRTEPMCSTAHVTVCGCPACLPKYRVPCQACFTSVTLIFTLRSLLFITFPWLIIKIASQEIYSSFKSWFLCWPVLIFSTIAEPNCILHLFLTDKIPSFVFSKVNVYGNAFRHSLVIKPVSLPPNRAVYIKVIEILTLTNFDAFWLSYRQSKERPSVCLRWGNDAILRRVNWTMLLAAATINQVKTMPQYAVYSSSIISSHCCWYKCVSSLRGLGLQLNAEPDMDMKACFALKAFARQLTHGLLEETARVTGKACDLQHC